MNNLEPKFWKTTVPISKPWHNHVFVMYYYHLPSHLYDDYFDVAIKWCVNQFGPPSDDPVRWKIAINSLTFYFRDDNDALAFKMRWC